MAWGNLGRVSAGRDTRSRGAGRARNQKSYDLSTGSSGELAVLSSVNSRLPARGDSQYELRLAGAWNPPNSRALRGLRSSQFQVRSPARAFQVRSPRPRSHPHPDGLIDVPQSPPQVATRLPPMFSSLRRYFST